MAKTDAYPWEFKARFRRHAFGWRSQPAIQRVKQAVSEIKRVARQDPVLAGEGAVLFLERVSPAIEQVDGSSGGIGSAVNHAIDALVPIIARAPIDSVTRQRWLDRLWDAHEADQMPYIESLGDHWGALCASKELASEWADRLVGTTRMALSPDPTLHGFFHGTSACLSALYRAERYQEIVDILQAGTIWGYQQWSVRALAAQGRTSAAVEATAARSGQRGGDPRADALSEEILLASGQVEDAYRVGLRASQAGTYLATFRSVARKYPHKAPSVILADLAATTPGSEAKWFAAAKEAGLYDEALDLAGRSPCDPRTLTRAARDLAEKQPMFALGSGLLALHWLVRGHGYEITGMDVLAAYDAAMKAAERVGRVDASRQVVKEMVATEGPGGFVARILGSKLGL
jgi:hypothetical protein